jgi:hypothetical protein
MDIRLKLLRLSPENFELAIEKLVALHAELSALHDPAQPAADLLTAFYRPLDTKPQPQEPQPQSLDLDLDLDPDARENGTPDP